MATFRFGRDVNMKWNGNEIVGPAGTIFRIEDAYYNEFNSQIGNAEPTLEWIVTNEFQALQASVSVATLGGVAPIVVANTSSGSSISLNANYATSTHTHTSFANNLQINKADSKVQLLNTTSGSGTEDGMYLLMADTDVGYLWNAETNGALVFGTGGAERARITPAGKFGIGTNLPAHQLEVVGPQSVTVGLSAGGAGFAELELVGQAGKNYITSDDTLSFDIGGTERATVATTGLDVTSGTLSQGGTAVSLSGHSHSAASTSAAGVVQLSDSVSTTSSVLAATPTAVKTAYDLAVAAAENVHRSFGFSSSAIETWPRGNAAPSASNWASTQRVQFAMFTPVKNLTVSEASLFVAGTTASGTTVARMGLYTWNESTETATLVAQTANDTTLFNTVSTLQTRSFDTTGGYPASYSLVAGTTYAFAAIWVGTSAPTVLGLSFAAVNAHQGIGGARVSGMRSSQSDLPSTASSLNNTATFRIWGRFS